MAKMRAYKLAEELGLDREDFLKKAAELGIALRSAMVGLEDDQIETLRRRLGGATVGDREEKRIGGTVIRRRRVSKKVEPEPIVAEAAPAEPVAEPSAEPTETDGVEGIPADGEAVEPAVAEEPAALPVDGADGAEEPLAADAPDEAPGPAARPAAAQPATPAGPQPAARPGAAPASERAPAPSGRRSEVNRPGAAKRSVRREASMAANLREQDTMARTMLGNVQHRLEQRRVIVEQQSRLQPRRRTKGGAGSVRRIGSLPPAKRLLRVGEEMTLSEIAGQTGVRIRDLLRRTRTLGLDLERDSIIDTETAMLLAEDIGIEAAQVSQDLEEVVAREEIPEEDLEPRPAVVTVMGHVNHGKTSLLDTLRRTNVVEGEAGGITQHIGAYSVESEHGPITFLDTPGHALFTQMRARGAEMTDLVILVIAADDGVMPQTAEAISHARAAGVPMIVAINKIDRAEADPARAKQALLEHEVVLEDFGGETLSVEVSATKGTNIDKLIEMVGLQSEILELKARKKGRARGTVVEARLDKGRGPIATVLVQEGTLSRGDALVVGSVSGRVRGMLDEHGEPVKQATPSVPVQVLGLSAVPEAGDEFVVVKNEREAKELVEHRVTVARKAEVSEASQMSADLLFGTLGAEEERELCIVLKSDVGGTLEAAREGIKQLETEKVKTNVVLAGVGGVTESDVMLASTAGAVIYGFHIRPDSLARKTAEKESVPIRTFDVIYELLDDVRGAMQGMLPPRRVEVVSGHAEVRQLFVIPRQGTVAGSFIPEGVIKRENEVRVLRDGVLIYSGKLASLRHFKDDVREVQSGTECGMRIENFDDVKVGDVLESFVVEEHAETL